MSNGLTKRRPGGGGYGLLGTRPNMVVLDEYNKSLKGVFYDYGTTTGRLPPIKPHAPLPRYHSKLKCTERWVLHEGKVIEVPASYDFKAMAVEYRNLPVMERWDHTKLWRFGSYNYLGWGELPDHKVPKQFKVLQLVL